MGDDKVKNILYGGELGDEIPVNLGELMLLMLRTHGDKVLQVSICYDNIK